jgi:hypothetical protein
MTDEQYDGPLVTMDGMRRQLEIAAKSGIEYQIQVAEHHKKSYYTIKTYENERSAQDFYYKTTCKPRGRRRLIKLDAGSMKVIYEHNGIALET